MADEPSTLRSYPEIARIERAIARIERASAARAYAADALARRHAALRTRMTEALEALDAVIARQEAKGRETA